MSTDLKPAEAASKSPVMEASLAFARAFMDSAVYREYLAAASAVEHDEKARHLLRQIEEAQADLHAKKSWGGITPEDIEQLNVLEAAMRAHETADRYVTAQEDVIACSKQLNEYVSQKLGADFARLAAPSHSCGCGSH